MKVAKKQLSWIDKYGKGKTKDNVKSGKKLSAINPDTVKWF